MPRSEIIPKKEFMEAAIKEALKARNKGDYAVGAVVVRDGRIISRAGNRVKLDADPTQHAEMVAIRKASKLLRARHTEGCVLYVTHEPCPMCASAAIWARMKGIVYGASTDDMLEFSSRNGNREWTWRVINIPSAVILKHGSPRLLLVEGFMRDECRKLFHC